MCNWQEFEIQCTESISGHPKWHIEAFEMTLRQFLGLLRTNTSQTGVEKVFKNFKATAIARRGWTKRTILWFYTTNRRVKVQKFWKSRAARAEKRREQLGHDHDTSSFIKWLVWWGLWVLLIIWLNWRAERLENISNCLFPHIRNLPEFNHFCQVLIMYETSRPLKYRNRR